MAPDEQNPARPQADREQPGGRLTGPDAGWRNMERNLAGDLAIAAAEAAARDDHRHGPDPGGFV